MRCLKGVVGMAFGVVLGCAEPEEGMPMMGEFDALTYNVHGLPPQITGDDTVGRMAQIAPLLEPFHILGLQEDFDDENHETLAAGVTHPTQVRFAEVVDTDRVYGSGLAVFARTGLVETYHEHYLDCNGVFDAASDCLASKGFQAVRLQFGPEPTHTLDVYNTHLEAGNGAADDMARAGHVDQLLAAMNGFSAGRAVLFLADTNLRDSDPEDLPIITRLIEDGGLSDLCVDVECPQPGRIDRILLRSSDAIELTPQQWWVPDAFVDDSGAPLSDHDPIAGRFTWTAK